MGLQIIPLSMGKLHVKGATLMSMTRFYDDIFSACYSWLILGGTKNILVDGGPTEPDWSRQYHREMTRTESEHLVPNLKKYGLVPGDIDILIATHLHWDHICAFEEIPDLPIFVQRKEINYAAMPYPRDYEMYETKLQGSCLSRLWHRLTPLNGDVNIIPGVRVILTPGHTPGSQAVLIDTGKGIYAIAGDTINLYSNLETTPAWPPGLYINLDDFYASEKKLRESCDVIIPGHDPSLQNKVFP